MNVACDCVLAVSDLVGDEAQRVDEKDHVAGCLKGLIHEPLIEKEILLVVNPIDSYHEGSDLVADSVQSELRRNSGRPPGGIQSRNNAKIEDGFSDRAVCRISMNPVRVGDEKWVGQRICEPSLIEKKQIAKSKN